MDVFVVMTPEGLPAGVTSSPDAAWRLSALAAAQAGRDRHDYPVYRTVLDLAGYVAQLTNRPASGRLPPAAEPHPTAEAEEWPPDPDFDSELESG